MSGERVVSPGSYTPDELRSAVMLREFEVDPLEGGWDRVWIKANTHGEAAVRWAEQQELNRCLPTVAPMSLFIKPILVAVAQVSADRTTRGTEKRFRVQVRFTRTYDVLEAK